MGANGIQREVWKKVCREKRQRCCNFTRALVRIRARNGALSEQSSIYLTCLCKSAIPFSFVYEENSVLSPKINNYWEKLSSLCANVSVFASVCLRLYICFCVVC